MMSVITPEFILAISALVVGVCMVLSGLLLLGFALHRLRAYNVYICFSIAALGFVRFAEHAAGQVDPRLVLACWINLAVGSLVGLVGVTRLAKTDPPFWMSRHGRDRRRS
jgi:hypothetical protein